MKQHVSYGWKSILAAVVLLGLVFSAQACEPAAPSQAVTLWATVRAPSGTTGTVALTFALEELPAASAVLPNASMLPPQPSAIPEPATLVLVGLGALGLVVWRKRGEKWWRAPHFFSGTTILPSPPVRRNQRLWVRWWLQDVL